MSYLDFDLEIEKGSGGRDGYRVVARCSAGDTRSVGQPALLATPMSGLALHGTSK